MCKLAVALYHNNIKTTLMAHDEGSCSTAPNVVLSATITVNEGSHELHAVLLSGDVATLTVAHATFLARAQYASDMQAMQGDETARRTRRLNSLEVHAQRACREGIIRDSRAGVRTATSPCDALLQLAHELRLEGDWAAATRLLAHVVSLSAHGGREGDLAHVVHVYPYLEMAKASRAAEHHSAAQRAMQTIHRLQPGYLLPAPYPTLPEEERGLTIDAQRIREANLEVVWHLVCEWTALEFVGPAGKHTFMCIYIHTHPYTHTCM